MRIRSDNAYPAGRAARNRSAIGGAAAYWATQALRGMLFQVDARDPITFMVASMVLVGVALVAATLPARRAAQVDPTRALASG